MDVNDNASLRASYLLLVLLVPPMGTVVITMKFFATLSGPTLPAVNSASVTVPVIAGGVSAIMASILALCLFVVYRQRNRYQRLHSKQNQFLNSMMEERLRMARSLDVLGAAHQVTLAIKQENSFERIASVVLEQIEFFSRANEVVLFLCTPENELDPRAQRFDDTNYFVTEIDQDELELDVAYEAMMNNRLVREYDPETGDYIVALPYATPDGIRGVVEIRRDASDDPDFEAELEHFEASLQQLVKAVSLGLKFSALWDRAIKDEMTGLFNKNHFNKELPRLLLQTLKSGRPFSLIMLDIDKFKQINDTFGHLPGDQILRQVSGIMLENLRENDMAFRYGGEELCIVCANTVDEDAARYAERLRSIIAHTEFRTETGQLVPVTASIGVAEFDPSWMKGEKEIKLACDEALYFGKENGRNLVVVNQGVENNIAIERSGDVASEVKRRLGLAGDNTPMDGPALDADRRGEPKPGKIGETRETAVLLASELGERVAPEATADNPEGLNDAERAIAARLAENQHSIRALAEQILAAAKNDSGRLAEVARIAETAAVAMYESRRQERAIAEGLSQPSNKDEARAVDIMNALRNGETVVVNDITIVGMADEVSPEPTVSADEKAKRISVSANRRDASDRRAQDEAAPPEGTPDRRRGSRRASKKAAKKAAKKTAKKAPRKKAASKTLAAPKTPRKKVAKKKAVRKTRAKADDTSSSGDSLPLLQVMERIEAHERDASSEAA